MPYGKMTFGDYIFSRTYFEKLIRVVEQERRALWIIGHVYLSLVAMALARFGEGNWDSF